ncbi:patatin-like phospholipase family protein [Thiolapillus brandeum]|uniref:Patatin-like phospholipase family protein n=2 Tax=Thiolapillus brandeum TaxID=1076588 RepID=A0A7U6JHM2_9GAMM|nr:patatin-like phospholipase family protein [Thiolapillus brandeum]
MMSFRLIWVFVASLLILAGCSSIGKVENQPLESLSAVKPRYSASEYDRQHPPGDTLMVLAFSGGGTRAAAMSYGVLEELRDTPLRKNGTDGRLLDEVDRISSVSGGSFTSAYYGLFGDRIFKDFREVFLYKDVQGELTDLVLGFVDLVRRLFTTESRTELAIRYYDKNIFEGKTFADLARSSGPFVLINASDLNSRSQFIFIQPQFDFLCSDLSRFKVARAVAASSAVPVVFAPILIKRHDDCHMAKPKWLQAAEVRARETDDQRLKEAVESLDFYLDPDNPPYATLVDGGITDNLGLRTILRNVGLSGGVVNMQKHALRPEVPPRRIVIIVVNASVTSATDIGKTLTLPSIADTLTAVTDMQLHLYNTETNELLKQELMQWARKLSAATNSPVDSYYINIDATNLKDEKERVYFNKIPTSFSLEKEQADRLIALARRMLKNNPEFRRLLHDLYEQQQ